MSLETIEPAITRQVQEAPARDPVTVTALLDDLRTVGSSLALVIARILEYLDDGLVDPAIALPAIAEACATLVAGVRGQLDQKTLAAAEYQIATLEPMPDKPVKIGTPDVSIIQLKRPNKP
ncbi:MAG TPA: hypothetical protein VGC41_14140 [Kofleriaceae bacterium]